MATLYLRQSCDCIQVLRNMQQLFSPRTLATYLGLAEQTIYNRHSTGGDLPKAIKLGHLLRFRPDDVDAWLSAKRQSTAAALPSVA
jgi:predicted DNA-binding transcriptional regulator AlpA